MGAFAEIRSFLRRVRRRMAFVDALEGAALTALALVALAATAVLSAWLFETAELSLVRLGTLAVAGAVTAGALVRHVVVPWRRLRRDTNVARHVESRLAVLRGDVLSCVELEPRLEEARRTGMFSAGLIEALATRTAGKLRAASPRDMVSWSQARRVAQLLLLVVVALGACVVLFPEPFAEGAEALAFGRRTPKVRLVDSRTREVEVLVGDISYTLVYPAYARRPSRTVSNSAGDLTALAGTQVRLETTSLVPASKASLVFLDGKRPPVPLQVEGDGRLLGEWTVQENAVFRFEVEQPDGTLVLERMRRVLEAEPDHPPTVELLRPATDIEVQTDAPLKLYFSAADDFGLAGIDVVTQREARDEVPVRRRVATLGSERSHVGDGQMDLRQLGLEPGESVTCWLEANDNNSVAPQPGTGRSHRIRVRLHSAEEHHKGLIEAQRQLLDQMLDILADRLESPIEQQSLPRYDTTVDAQNDIARATERMLAALDALLAVLGQDPLSADATRDDLRELKTRHEEMLGREIHHIKAALGEGRSSERVQHLAVLLRDNASTVAELERDILRLDQLIDMQHQKQLVTEARALAESQRELVALMEQLKKTDDPALRMQIQQRIARLTKRLDKLLSDMRTGYKPAPYENMNLSALEPGERISGLRAMKSSLQKMQDALREGRMDDALKLAEQLGKETQALTSLLEADLQETESEGGRQRALAMQKLTSDLEKLAARQDSVHRQVKELMDVERRELTNLVRRELAPQIARDMEKIHDLAKKLDKVEPQDLHADDAKKLGEIEQAVSDLKETLSQEDLSQALRMAKDIDREIRALEREVELGAERMEERDGDTYLVKKRRRNRARLAAAKPRAHEIAEDLEKMMPGPGDLLDRKGRLQLRKLSERQKRARERLQRLQEGLSEMEEQIPGIRARLDAPLEQAAQAMEEARQRMDDNRPGKAEAHAREALDRLNETRQLAEKLTEREGRASEADAPGRMRSGQRVAIPDADRHTVPKEFRDEMLKAMKERAPSPYRRLVERYYEALIQ